MKQLAAALLICGCVGCVAASSQRSNFIMEDGFVVRSYSDGSASVGLGTDFLDFGWSIDCRVDAMSDRRKCSFYSETGGLLVDYGTGAAPQRICIVGHDFPGRNGMIRVDDKPPVVTNSAGCVPASRLLAQLSSGQNVTTRRFEWPYDHPRDHSHTLNGFGKVLEVVGRIRSGTMPITDK